MIKAPHDHNDTIETFQRTRSTDYDVEMEEDLRQGVYIMDFLVALTLVACAIIISNMWEAEKKRNTEVVEQTTDEKTISKAKETR